MTIVVPHNRSGSIEHFYHYLLGYLVPLFANHSMVFSEPGESIFLRSCGPMDPHTISLGMKDVAIVDKQTFRTMTTEAERIPFLPRKSNKRLIHLHGLDRPEFYNQELFDKAVKGMQQQWGDRWSRAVDNAKRAFGPAAVRILFVRRNPPHPFYASEASEMRGAGSSRRSIANHDEILAEIRQQLGSCYDAALEALTLVDQAALFSFADVVIAQHGAALANAIWLKQGAAVIEIRPRAASNGKPYKDYFRPLSKICRAEHHVVEQRDNHAAVFPHIVISSIHSCLGAAIRAES